MTTELFGEAASPSLLFKVPCSWVPASAGMTPLACHGKEHSSNGIRIPYNPSPSQSSFAPAATINRYIKV